MRTVDVAFSELSMRTHLEGVSPARSHRRWVEVAGPGCGSVLAILFLMGLMCGGGGAEPGRQLSPQSPALAVVPIGATNGFQSVAGDYRGLFHETNEVRLASSGSVFVSLGSRGAFSGRVSMNGGTHSFSGRFDLDGRTLVEVRHRGRRVLEMAMELDWESASIAGTVSDGVWVSELNADRAFAVSADRTAPYEGVYTLAIPGDAGGGGVVGDGYVKFWIDYYGRIHAGGRLADGTPVSASIKILRTGLWPLYIPLYGGRGTILGWIQFTGRPVSGVGGEVVWFKSANVAARYYPAGMTNQSSAIGSTFFTPHGVRPSGSVAITNGVLVLTGGNLPASLTNTFTGPGAVTTINGLSLRLNAIRGTLTGSFVHPATGRRADLRGVLLQNQGIGRGYFLGTNQSGRFNLQQ